MSIENEITRIETAKLNIKEAIQEKGIEVEDTTIDNYPDKIRQIQTVSIEVIEKLQAAINSHSKELKLFCVEPVTIIVEDTEYICQVNEVTTVFVGDKSFEIIPQSNNSIQSLLNYPIPLVWYDWLEGVDVFENIIFDMNSWDTYHHWNQNYQAEYHVQKAQYINCIFWSDNPYIQTPLSDRTNYTIYYSSSLPLCYSTIPENTYKPFYCAYGVQDDPNWRNSEYVSSFSNVVEATQTWSYYGARSIGVYNMGIDIITLPKDCRGLMFYATSIQNVGILDATKTTTFGAKSGSWRDAFGSCYMLENLYIQNLKVSINVSWSPINNASIEFIVNSAANTSKIYIYVSPYTWYRLTDSIKQEALSKNIEIQLLSGNYIDDLRLSNSQDKLISGINIKTINENSILGEGNINLYEKPSTGIPKSDLDTYVQNSLNKADSASQGYRIYEIEVNASSNSTDVTFKTNPYFDISYEYSLNKILPILYITNLYITNTYIPLICHNEGGGDVFYGHSVDVNNNRIYHVYLSQQNSTITVDTYYTKPTNGIPTSDLDSSVQILLSRANTALQSVPSEYITESELNAKGFVTNSTVNSAIEQLEELINDKQDNLVSGTNIKRINGQSILGSGNITISQPNMTNYYTKSEIDSILGDINRVLESIINGGNYGYSVAGYSETDLLNIVDEVLE